MVKSEDKRCFGAEEARDMANIMDYLDWRGDLPFASDPMNEDDSYILSKIGCPDFTGIVPADGETIPLGEAVEAYFAQNGIEGDKCEAAKPWASGENYLDIPLQKPES